MATIFKQSISFITILFLIASCSGGGKSGKPDSISEGPSPDIVQPRQAEVFGDFVFFVPANWTRAPKEVEVAEDSYMFGNEHIQANGESHILIINKEVKQFSSPSSLEKAIQASTSDWKKKHPQSPDPDYVRLARMKMLRMTDVVEGDAGEEPSTSFSLLAARKNMMYSMLLIVPGKNVAWPGYADDLFDRIRFQDEIKKAMNEGPPLSIALPYVAEDFRIACRFDFLMALKFIERPVREKFLTFQEGLWPAIEARTGWAHFMEQSVISIGKEDEKGTVVSFYNPWADVFLLTVWRRGKSGVPTITDAEVLLGDALRNGGTPPFTAEPAWYREKTFGPFAVGLVTTRAIEAFENRFGPDSKVTHDWRKSMSLLRNQELLESNYYGAGIAIARIASGLYDVIEPENEKNDPAKVREKMIRLLKLLKKGEIKKVLSEASQTLPKAAETLKSITFDDWKNMKPASFVQGDEKSVLMLASADNPDIFMGLFFDQTGKTKIKRIDVLSFSAFYRERQSFGR